MVPVSVTELLGKRGMPLSRLIERDIKDALADELLFGRLAKGGQVRVDAGDDGFTFEFPAS